MSSLPNPKDFNNFKIELSNRIEFDEMQQDYDLNNIYNSFKKNPIPAGYISKIFDIDILKYNPKAKEILKEYVTFSKEDDSLVITLKNNEEIKTIAIHRSLNKDNKIIKWKTYGSKKYIHHKIKDDFVFIVYGMSEILLCELFDISYIAFQSDSIALNLNNHTQWIEEIKPKLENKYLLLLLDNDESCRKTINPIKEQFEESQIIIPIEMEDLEVMEKAFLYGGTLKQQVPKGFDFRDYCNEIKNPQKIEEILKETIKAKLWILKI